MQKASSALSPRDELLRRVGRNVVNFQYLEATLRSLVPSLAGEGTLPELQSNLDAAVRRYKKATLGNLADAFLGGIFEPDNDSSGAQDGTPNEVRLRISLHLEFSPEERAEQRKALTRLVVERNRLVHRQVLSVDLNSPEQCGTLSEQLDEQNKRLRAEILHLNALRQAHQSALEELARFVQTDEFMSALRGDTNDA